MSATPDSTLANPDQRIADLERQLAEALAQQTATADVLQVINSSPGDLAPVFGAILDKAHDLCGVAAGSLQINKGGKFRAVAMRGVPDPVAELLRRPFEPKSGAPAFRLLAGEPFIHIADMLESSRQRPDNPRAAMNARHGIRTVLFVPLRKDTDLLGYISAYRFEVRAFTDKQIALLQNFAGQAVIAMENARLITETREALEQQTATAEVLQIINSCPGDLAPVFDAMLEKATRLCEAPFGILRTWDGERFHLGAVHGDEPRYRDWAQQRGPIRPDRDASPLGRILAGERVVNFADAPGGEGYRTSSGFRDMVESSGVRSAIWVALRKDDALLGVIIVYRQEVRPFSDKQIALLQNFAAQAVIAIENARLLTETQEALEQQTATAEVLQVINSSPGNLAPVFDVILEKAHTLCGAAHGSLTLVEGEHCRAVATRGMPEEFAKVLRQPFDPGRLGDRLSSGEPLIQISDIAATSTDSSVHRAAVGPGGVRTLLAVPLRKDGALLGYITANRREVRPFTDKQIALLQNFAAQAVIAMENARLLTATREALDQQTATAEVLQVINSSPGDLAPVFEVMLDRAIRLCDAAYGVLWTYNGDGFRAATLHGVPQPYAASLSQEPTQFASGTNTALGQIAGGSDFAHFDDVANEEGYMTSGARRLIELGGARTMMMVALRKDDKLLGAISAFRQEVRPFADKQIALLQNFAAQAVIAMENARLINETREALEQQTATAEVLGVINSSPGDLAPVFEAMLDKAMRLCGFDHGSLQTYDGQLFRAVAVRGLPEPLAEQLRGGYRPELWPPTRPLVDGARLVHVPDLTQEEQVEGVRLAVESGSRTLLFIPLRKDDALVGTIVAVRQEIRPFGEKEISLLENFAAQAVIAMENARLLGELRQRTEQIGELNRDLEARVAEQGDAPGGGQADRCVAPPRQRAWFWRRYRARLRDSWPDRLFRTLRLHRNRHGMQPRGPALC
jgi:GAF domain-containing protein